ncbi:hypothetical protein [Helicobacter sp. MIT 14-3879]|uniref:hypothetical protein n=1 Tax=Helicobacter sp. MIT 14-3879 TaxID=2040649 RepID=UPI000E1F56A5|nr:hypothetical protein [Helicobacter sp. MIT 14-3879]RDU62907.1 hypothetical protein CQA44_06320 [Helicobacter sp. MIT 14-3879]
MKNIQTIISNLAKKNNFKRLNSLNIINKLILTLPHNLRKSILFPVIKKDILLIAMNHPASASEFNNFKAKDILILLDMLKEEQNNIALDEIKNIKQIKAYVPKDILNRFSIVRKEIPKDDVIVIETYEERSNGEFYIDCNNVFKQQFEDIRLIIKNNNETSRHN